MNRGILEEEGRAVLWHNFYGDERTPEEDIIREFESNAARLRERANGNVLYHEILSFSRGHELEDEELFRIVADIGQEYLSTRAPRQLGYGVIHRDTDHIHLHLMVSSNQVGKSERVRLSKKEFSDIQKQVERFALERYPELAQTKVYDRERGKEKLKTDTREQAMKNRTKAPSRKESLKARLHSLFERASNRDEFERLAKAEGVRFYTRGKSVGVIVQEPEGGERRHRLSTLGVEEHFRASLSRLEETDRGTKTAEKTRKATMGNQEKPEPERTDAARDPEATDLRTALEQEIEQILKSSREPKAEKTQPDRGGAEKSKSEDRGRDDDR